MRVLICDDEPAARYVSRRWLTTLLGCDVTECGDGVQALELLATRPFDAAILDLDMPGLSGVEVVETLRASEELRDLPIVILSQERRASVIRALVDLGVAAYLLKPLREESVLGRLAPLLDRIRARRARPGPGRSRPTLRPGEPVMLVDGDTNFTHVFATVAAPFGACMTAESGAAALVRFRQAPVSMVFVGRDLGLVNAAALARKIREVRPETFLVGVGYTGAEATPFDAAMQRTFMPAVLAAEIGKFSAAQGPLESLESLAPGFRACLRSAVHQVFGMIASLEVAEGTVGPEPGTEVLISSVTVVVAGTETLELEFVMPGAVADAATTRALECAAAAVDREGAESTASEFANVISGRLNTWLKEHGRPCTCKLPRTRRGVMDDAPHASEAEFVDHFALPELGAAISVRGRVPGATPAPSRPAVAGVR